VEDVDERRCCELSVVELDVEADHAQFCARPLPRAQHNAREFIGFERHATGVGLLGIAVPRRIPHRPRQGRAIRRDQPSRLRWRFREADGDPMLHVITNSSSSGSCRGQSPSDSRPTGGLLYGSRLRGGSTHRSPEGHSPARTHGRSPAIDAIARAQEAPSAADRIASPSAKLPRLPYANIDSGKYGSTGAAGWHREQPRTPSRQTHEVAILIGDADENRAIAIVTGAHRRDEAGQPWNRRSGPRHGTASSALAARHTGP